MQFSKVHCLFERSGTFKKAFQEMGYDAKDYDIVETNNVDVVVNLFDEIEEAINEGHSAVFDSIGSEDLVVAFFPCTFFSDQSQLLSRGDSHGMEGWDEKKKLEYSLRQMKTRAWFYSLLCNLCIIAIEKGFKLIIENPYGKENFLKQFFPIKPALVTLDRRKLGDFYKKPTQFFFINCVPEFSLLGEKPITKEMQNPIEKRSGFDRSLISPDFAELFIKNFILDI